MKRTRAKEIDDSVQWQRLGGGVIRILQAWENIKMDLPPGPALIWHAKYAVQTAASPTPTLENSGSGVSALNKHPHPQTSPKIEVLWLGDLSDGWMDRIIKCQEQFQSLLDRSEFS